MNTERRSSTQGEVQEIFVGESRYVLVQVPPGVVNGIKAVGGRTAIVANCATHPHDPAEIRRIDPMSPDIPYNWDLHNG